MNAESKSQVKKKFNTITILALTLKLLSSDLFVLHSSREKNEYDLHLLSFCCDLGYIVKLEAVSQLANVRHCQLIMLVELESMWCIGRGWGGPRLSAQARMHQASRGPSAGMRLGAGPIVKPP
ncbi:hypothetical protein C0J52_12744 [Blattella germanica]|nr:hypothetical protein C0J52_12744 [Blattella germanica]